MSVTGPIIRWDYAAVDRAGSYSDYRKRYKQTPPFRDPLPYYRDGRYVLDAKIYDPSGHYGATNFAGMADATTSKSPDWIGCSFVGKGDEDVKLALNKAYGRMMNKVQQSQLGSTLAEGRQAMDTITNRASQLASALGHAKRGNFWAAAEVFGNPKDTKWKRQSPRGPDGKPGDNYWRYRAKTTGDQYLEIAWGVIPTVNDIIDSVKVLDSGYADSLVRGKCDLAVSRSFINPGFYGFIASKHQMLIRARCAARVTITNPNLALATNLGLTNPAAVLWEVFPYSWLLDYFGNMSQWLKSFTDLHGCTVSGAYHTTKVTNVVTSTSRFTSDFPVVHTYGWDIKSQSVSFERMLGLPEVTLQYRWMESLSPQRAATAVALLLSNFKPQGQKPKP